MKMRWTLPSMVFARQDCGLRSRNNNSHAAILFTANLYSGRNHLERSPILNLLLGALEVRASILYRNLILPRAPSPCEFQDLKLSPPSPMT